MEYKKWTINYTISMRKPMCSFTVSINGIFALLIPAGILIIGSAVDYKEFLLNFIFYILFTPICTVMMTKIMRFSIYVLNMHAILLMCVGLGNDSIFVVCVLCVNS